MSDDTVGIAAAAAMAALAIGFLWIENQDESNKKEEPKPSAVAVSALTGRRGSEGMNLPASMSKTTIDTIIATSPAVAPKALDITRHFYAKVIAKYPHLLAFFNPSHNVPLSLHQPKALAASIVAYATHIADLSPLLVPGGAVEAICHRHCGLGIFPDSYVVVHDNLMESIGEVLGSIVTPEIANAWSEAVLFLAKAFIDTEESLYKMAEQREGGWSGTMEFEVSEIKQVATNIKSFSFKPPRSSPLYGKSFQFTPGQYLSLTVDVNKDGLTAPRHYTVTSPPGADFLQCTVKKIRGGVVSTYINEYLKVGDTVKLAAPFGVFTLKPDDETVKSAVLMSAGIGITPMLNFARTLGSKVRLCVHLDRTPEAHAYRNYFSSVTKDKERLIKYSQVPGGKRPSVKELVDEVLERVGGDHHFYICGPESWMTDMQDKLVKRGAKHVTCEVFGSQLATGCPFFTNQ